MRRRAYEEYKRGNGLGDEPVSRDLMESNPNWWDIIINGGANYFECIRGVTTLLIDGLTTQELSWEGNDIPANRMVSTTGIRTSLPVNLYDCMRQGKVDVTSSGLLSLLTNIGGGWLESRYG